MSIAYYGGKSSLVPISINDFMTLMNRCWKCNPKSRSERLRNFLKSSVEFSRVVSDEIQWQDKIYKLVNNI